MAMKNRKGTKKEGGRFPLRHLENERGMLLVIVMVVMLVVASLAASSLINSFLEKSLSENQNYASIALQAADGGLADGLTWIRENRDAIPDAAPWLDVSGNPWAQTINGSLASGGHYQVTMSFKLECNDYDNDGNCAGPGEYSGYSDGDAGDPENGVPCPGEIVLYNSCSRTNDQCWGLSGSLFTLPGEGFPIIEILSIGYYSPRLSAADVEQGKYGSVREIAMDVARNKLDIQVEGAITARGSISQSGSGYADGHNFNIAGDALSDTCSDKPAVTVDQGLTPPPCAPDNDVDNPPSGNPSGLYGGADCTAEHDPTAPGKRALDTTPWGLMGIDETTFETLFHVADPDPAVADPAFGAFTGTQANPSLVWHQEDMHITGGSGFGILVVHNKNFHPDTWEVSDPGCDTVGCTPTNPLYNPDPSAGYVAAADISNGTPPYDPSYAPATLFMNGIADFTGVIIADNILRVNGTAETIGAMISLGGVNIDGDVTGNWTAKYSCDAVEAALAGFGYGTKLNWHRIR
jgi:type II secretory pathway pseudopilin PulG